MIDEIIEIISPAPSNSYLKYVIQPDLDFIKMCAGINEDLLGKAEND